MIEALRVMLFGMLGIFVVMGVLIGAIYLLKAVSKKS